MQFKTLSGFESINSCVFELLCTSHGTHMNESWHTCEWVMSHIWMTHVTHMNESWHTYEWVMALITWVPLLVDTYVWYPFYQCHDSFICVPWLIRVCLLFIHMCDMTHSYVWHDSFICVTWLIHMRDMTDRAPLLQVCIIHKLSVPWLIHRCAMTHLCVCHDSFKCVPWLIHRCDIYYSYMWHDSQSVIARRHACNTHMLSRPWLIHMCAMTHSYVCHDSFTCVPWRIHVCHMTES